MKPKKTLKIWVELQKVMQQFNENLNLKNEGLDHNESNLDSAFVSGSCTAQNSDSYKIYQ